MPASVEVTKPRRSLLQAYRDYASRNWPLWWSLKLGMPLGYAVVIVALTSIYGLTADISELKTIDSELYAKHRHSPAPTEQPSLEQWERVQIHYSQIVDRVMNIASSLISIPLYASVLFMLLWYFYIGRSLKFTYSPKIRHQPRYWALILIGTLILCGSLVGFKMFQWKNHSINLLDFSMMGNIFNDKNKFDSAKRIFQGEYDAMEQFFIASSFVSAGAVFVLLQRHVSFGGALSGIVTIIVSMTLILMVGGVVGAFRGLYSTEFSLATTWLVLAIAAAGTFIYRRKLSGLSGTAFCVLLYLTSLWPIPYLARAAEIWLNYWLGIDWIISEERSSWFLKIVSDIGPGGFFLCLAISVLACELLLSLLNRFRLRPS